MAKNDILKEIENQKTQEQFVALMRYKSKYGEVIDEGKNWQWSQYLDKDGMWADKAEYIGILGRKPDEIKDWTAEFDLSKHKPRGAVSQTILITQKKIFDDVFSHDIEKMALENPEKQKELFAQRLEALASEASWYRDAYITGKIADPTKINVAAIKKVDLEKLKDPRAVVTWLLATAAMMTIPSDKWNKDKKITCVKDPKEDLILVIHPILDACLSTNVYSGANNLSYVNLKEQFVRVVTMSMPHDIVALLVDKKGVGAPLTIHKTYTKFEEGNMLSYIFQHIWFDADLLTHLPVAACQLDGGGDLADLI